MHNRTGRRAVLAVLSLLLWPALPALAAVEHGTDRFTGRYGVTVRSPLPERDGRPELTATVSWDAAHPETVKTVAVGIIRIGRSWRFLSCPSLDWLADGKPVDLGAVKHGGEVLDGPAPGVVETLVSYSAPLAAVRKLALADRVEFRACGDTYVLPAPSIVDLWAMVQEVELMNATAPPPMPGKARKARPHG